MGAADMLNKVLQKVQKMLFCHPFRWIRATLCFLVALRLGNAFKVLLGDKQIKEK